MKREVLSHLTLAEGEHTGHRHVASGGVLVMENGTMLWEGAGGATVTHQEHAPITAPADDNLIERVLEYDHAAEAVKRVED